MFKNIILIISNMITLALLDWSLLYFLIAFIKQYWCKLIIPAYILNAAFSELITIVFRCFDLQNYNLFRISNMKNDSNYMTHPRFAATILCASMHEFSFASMPKILLAIYFENKSFGFSLWAWFTVNNLIIHRNKMSFFKSKKRYNKQLGSIHHEYQLNVEK